MNFDQAALLDRIDKLEEDNRRLQQTCFRPLTCRCLSEQVFHFFFSQFDSHRKKRCFLH